VVVGILGPLPFVGGYGSTFTFHEIAKTRKETFVRHKLINGLDLIEATGSEPIEISFAMSFFAPYTRSPAASILLLETLLASRLPVPLFAGDAPVGRGLLTLFVVEAISNKLTKWVGSTTVSASVEVKLLEYSNPFNLAGPLNALAGAGASVIGKFI